MNESSFSTRVRASNISKLFRFIKKFCKMQENHTIKIKPSSWLSTLDLSELWHYRELFYLLVWRDMKVRYKQTLLGILWAVLQPALTALIFTIVFSRVAKVETGDVPYWLFVLSGFTFWTFVSSSVNMSANAFVHHTQLVTKVYFPRMILPGFVGRRVFY